MSNSLTDPHLAACVHASRQLGGDPSLVLHGGGNTSAKSIRIDVTGQHVEVLYVKGSGHDLATIEPDGFTPLRLNRVRELASLSTLDDLTLVNELHQASFDAGAPEASIETILHGILPHRFVLHTHADAIVTLTNQICGKQLVTDTLGPDILVLPYLKPGFGLAVQVAEALRELDVRSLRGIVLLNHGLFTFADDVDQALTTHLDLVKRAQAALPTLPARPSRDIDIDPLAYAQLRNRWSAAAGTSLILERRTGTDVDIMLARDDIADLATRGPLTPEHVIHTKRVPIIGSDFDAYTDAYRAYVQEHRSNLDDDATLIDPAPRVLLDETFGFVTAGSTPKAAAIAADITEHTAAGILRAEAMTGYRPLSAAEAFEIEYWVLEQRRLAASRKTAPFAGEIALVTGAASGIGRACAIELQKAGAVVIAIDRDPAVANENNASWFGIAADVTTPKDLCEAVVAGVRRFGGLDIVVPAAGIFATSHPIDGFPEDSWQKSMSVNVTGLLTLLSAVHPYLALAPRGGRVVLIGSKNVPAPGPGASAYSASKAAASQLARVAALEWAADGIRVNIVNPDAVFDTGLWTPELLAERAAKYGITIDEYKRRNLLRAEITSVDVGRLVVAMSGELFHATTGAQVPIDGGSDRIV